MNFARKPRDRSSQVDAWQPISMRITSKVEEAEGIYTYGLEPAEANDEWTFSYEPGQFNMLYVPGVGEAAISIADFDDSTPLPAAYHSHRRSRYRCDRLPAHRCNPWASRSIWKCLADERRSQSQSGYPSGCHYCGRRGWLGTPAFVDRALRESSRCCRSGTLAPRSENSARFSSTRIYIRGGATRGSTFKPRWIAPLKAGMGRSVSSRYSLNAFL